MSEIPVETFLNYLQKSRLFSDAQLESLRKKTANSTVGVARLSDMLVDQNRITPWQARQLRKGETGFVLDHYQLLNPIGRGGMGHVFRGRDTQTGDIVAVKVMARKLTNNRTLVARFRREIRASSQLNSPHIVTALDAGRVGKVDFMVMEFVNGDQLDRIANVLQKVPSGLACEMVRQAAVGLQHAHENSMVHRDVKPANMMLNWSDAGEGVVKLMDMGLVLLTDDSSGEETVTRAGQVMGTPDFMSPEQGWDTASVDIRSDVYALGCTLYRLLTGTVPFAGTNPLQVLSQRLQRDAPSVQTICPEISDEVAAVVSRMTRRDPDDRYQHPAEVATALHELCEPLTRQTMKTVVSAATNDPDANADVGKASDEDVDEDDGTYRQFLKEVQDGSSVNLMLGTGSSGSISAETIPALDLKFSTARPARPATRRRGQKTGFIVMGAAVAALAGLLAMTFPRKHVAPKPNQEIAASTTTTLPTVTITESEAKEARLGEQWQHTIGAVYSNDSGTPGFRLGSSAPPTMLISKAGAMSWSVPVEQTPGVYDIDVIPTHEHDGVVRDLDSISVPVKVVPGFAAITMNEPSSPLVIGPLEEFTVDAASDSPYSDLFALKYELSGNYPPSLSLDADTGQVAWIPDIKDIGRHDVTIAVYDVAAPQTQQTSTYRIIVRPMKIEHVLPEISLQQATAGETFQMELPRQPFKNRRRIKHTRIVLPAPGAPAGLTIDRETGNVVWPIPIELSGVMEIPLLCQIALVNEGRTESLDGQAILRIDVSPVTPKPAVVSMPPADDVTKAVEDLKKTLARSIGQARTSAAKAELARRLFEQSLTGEHGVFDAALLSLIETELATKARATDVLLQIASLRKKRYGVDPAEAITRAVDSVRRTSLSPLQHDATVESCMSLAKNYSEAQNFELTESLLQAVSSVLGRNPSGASKVLEADVKEALNLVGTLNAEGGDSTGAVATTELSRLLSRWAFQPALTDSTAFTFVQISVEGSEPALADNGRSAWSTTNSHVSLTAESAPVNIGLIMALAKRSSRFVVRFDLMPDSNCAHFLFGVTGGTDQEFNAYRLALNGAETGAIQSLRPRKTVAKVSASSKLFSDQSNLVELVVDGENVSASINGVLLSQAKVSAAFDGRIGFLADLRVPSPKILIRNPRILILPDSQ